MLGMEKNQVWGRRSLSVTCPSRRAPPEAADGHREQVLAGREEEDGEEAPRRLDVDARHAAVLAEPQRGGARLCRNRPRVGGGLMGCLQGTWRVLPGYWQCTCRILEGYLKGTAGRVLKGDGTTIRLHCISGPRPINPGCEMNVFVAQVAELAPK